MSARVLRSAAPLVVAAFLAITIAGCSSSKDDAAANTDETTASSDVAKDPSASDSAEDDPASEDASGDEPATRPAEAQPLDVASSTTVSDIACSSSSAVSTEADDAAAELPDPAEIDCGESHDVESFSITGAPDLDECYRIIAASSDIVVIVDEDGELDFDDERVSGHSFGGYDGEFDCQISLAEPRAEALIHR